MRSSTENNKTEYSADFDLNLGIIHLFPGIDLDNFTFQYSNDDHFIINPGSVGQPRDLDPRSSYAILDDETKTVEFFRLDYDIETVREKIHAIPELSNWLGDRLLEGR